MPTVDRRLYLTEDGRLVERGDPDGRFLWSAEGVEVTDDEAERVGYQPRTKSAEKPDDKSTTAPDNKSEDSAHVCDVCGFEAKSAGGLGAHVRSHDE